MSPLLSISEFSNFEFEAKQKHCFFGLIVMIHLQKILNITLVIYLFLEPGPKASWERSTVKSSAATSTSSYTSSYTPYTSRFSKPLEGKLLGVFLPAKFNSTFFRTSGKILNDNVRYKQSCEFGCGWPKSGSDLLEKKPGSSSGTGRQEKTGSESESLKTTRIRYNVYLIKFTLNFLLSI